MHLRLLLRMVLQLGNTLNAGRKSPQVRPPLLCANYRNSCRPLYLPLLAPRLCQASSRPGVSCAVIPRPPTWRRLGAGRHAPLLAAQAMAVSESSPCYAWLQGGMRLSSLRKLADTRSFDGSTTLMHYLVALLSQAAPEVRGRAGGCSFVHA